MENIRFDEIEKLRSKISDSFGDVMSSFTLPEFGGASLATSKR